MTKNKDKDGKDVSVRVNRRFQASAERVFDAWLDSDRAGKFLFSTPGGVMVKAEIDARVGGKFCFVDRRAGEDVEHIGEYLEIERPRRLVFSFAVPKYSPQKTTVTIEIVALPNDSGCELTLTQDGVLGEYQARTLGGWTKILEGLHAQVTSRPSTPRKEAALAFLRMSAAGQSRDAFEQLVATADFRHHNIHFKGDAESLMTAMEAAATANPDKLFDVHRALEDADLVAVHSHVRQKPGDLGAAVIHIFRFNDAGKVVELWDVGQPVSDNGPNENGLF